MKLHRRDKRAILTAAFLTVALYLLVTLTGCVNLKNSAQVAVAAGATTTAIGMASGATGTSDKVAGSDTSTNNADNAA